MLARAFKGDSFNLAELQFTLAIVLDLNGEKNAAPIILQMFADDSKARDALESLIRKNSKHGIVYDYIDYLFNNPVLERKVNLVNNAKEKCSLRSLITKVSVDSLYSGVMQTLLCTDVNKLIHLYMQTSMWEHWFRYAVRKVSSNLPLDQVGALSDGFKTFVRDASSNGSYDVKSCTPHAFLLHTFQAFYVNTEKFREILSNKSMMQSIGKDDKRSRIEMQSDAIDIEQPEEGIDFMSIAGKIYRSSYSLFNHVNDNGIAYYDIFSWYRKSISDRLWKRYKQILRANFSSIEFSREIAEHDGSKSIKLSKRIKLCEVYANRLMSTGIEISDIYNFYLEVVAAADKLCVHMNTNGGANDGIPYYASEAIHPKKGCNQDKFKADYEGFIALRELVAYLGSSANDTGYTVFNFPVDIFRDKNLLKRFSSLKEYLYMYKDVTSLVNEVYESSGRDVDRDAKNLVSNDCIFDQLLSYKLNSSPTLIKKAYSLSLAKGKEAINSVGKSATVLLAENYNRAKNDISNGWLNKVNDPHCLDSLGNDTVKKINTIVGWFKTLINALTTSTNKRDKYTASVTIVNVISTLLSLLNNPVDVNGMYSLEGPNMLTVLTNAVAANPTTYRYDSRITAAFAQVFDMAARILNDLPADTPVNKLHMYTAFSYAKTAYRANVALSNFCSFVVQELRSEQLHKNENNLYLLYAKALANYSWIELRFPFEKREDITKLCGDDCRLFMDPRSMHDVIQSFQNIYLREVKVINIVLESFQPLFKFIGDFSNDLHIELQETDSASALNSKEIEILQKANQNILITKAANRFKYVLESSQKFDANNYVLGRAGLGVLLQDDIHKVFVHKYGYKVIIIAYTNGQSYNFDIQELNEYDIECIKRW